MAKPTGPGIYSATYSGVSRPSCVSPRLQSLRGQHRKAKYPRFVLQWLTKPFFQIPVYEFQFGTDLREHVMRRRSDDWVNATHILKAAGFDKPARTRILERDVQKSEHEKIQGGYGKYQGTDSLTLASKRPLAHG